MLVCLLFAASLLAGCLGGTDNDPAPQGGDPFSGFNAPGGLRSPEARSPQQQPPAAKPAEPPEPEPDLAQPSNPRPDAAPPQETPRQEPGPEPAPPVDLVVEENGASIPLNSTGKVQEVTLRLLAPVNVTTGEFSYAKAFPHGLVQAILLPSDAQPGMCVPLGHRVFSPDAAFTALATRGGWLDPGDYRFVFRGQEDGQFALGSGDGPDADEGEDPPTVQMDADTSTWEIHRRAGDPFSNMTGSNATLAKRFGSFTGYLAAGFALEHNASIGQPHIWTRIERQGEECAHEESGGPRPVYASAPPAIRDITVANAVATVARGAIEWTGGYESVAGNSDMNATVLMFVPPGHV